MLKVLINADKLQVRSEFSAENKSFNFIGFLNRSRHFLKTYGLIICS
jgi:hypothetical protein